MPTDHRAVLAKIKRFDQLIAYLRDEMGWPIARDSFEDVDDLFYDFTADELGIDPKNAAKIQEIKRLRPLSPRQPWGIFFVKFEPKKLPVVALRRILSQVALKKRASANSAERAAWTADDLLFVSNYGEGDERQISFAHFSQADARDDLPTLKVLGWNNLDTGLHLDAVAKELTQHLAWPEHDDDIEAWRHRWRAAFTLRHREVIVTSKELSIRLAELARAIRDRTKTALGIETETGPLTRLLKAFQELLVHDLDADGFADMYAQTIAYGLLSARIADPSKKTADDFAAHMRTNPFLRELMETFLKIGGRRGKAGGPGIDFDELGVNEVMDLLDDANMEAVVRDFGDRNPQEDPVIHFYQDFLQEYDAKKRVHRGVYYTPRPVVSYIVRSVDELLRTEFGFADGLADTTTWGEMAKRHNDLKIPRGVTPEQDFVQILDPATGTGTFLVEAIDLIHKTVVAKWKAQGHGEKKIETLWNEYVPTHLLPRLHGYELLMAPYAIAHLKIGLKLYETGYRFGSDERARIYLTNALETAHDFSGTFAFAIPALAHEAEAVNEIKRKQRFTVVIGNPPYAGVSANMSEATSALVDPYKFVDGQPLGERKHWLQDDYVKFIRLGQLCVESAGCGILGYITNHGYLDNPTFRGMRQNLMETFSEIRVLDLNGSVKKRNETTLAKRDENVFDIEQGVAIGILARRERFRDSPKVWHTAILGPRDTKYDWLMRHALVSESPLQPSPPFHFFVTRDETYREEYGKLTPITAIFHTYSTGVQTSRDHLVVAFDRMELRLRIERFINPDRSDKDVRSEFFPGKVVASYKAGDTRQWALSDARKALRGDAHWQSSVQPCLYRPFDWRQILYDERMVDWPRPKVMFHMLAGRNVALLSPRQLAGESFHHAFCTRHLAEMCVISSKSTEQNNLFPLYRYDQEDGLALSQSLRKGRRDSRTPNLQIGFLKAIAENLDLEFEPNEECPRGLTPEDIFHYIYAVLHSPSYRRRYSEFLKIDFPRIPLPGSLQLFRDLARGGELVALHLMESPKLEDFITTYTGPKNPEVGRVGWSDDTVWLDAAAAKKGQPAKPGTIGFRGVPEGVWNFNIGGYQVCEKWLKDRKGRTLSKDDIAHFQKIVVALNETIRLMKEIDEVIEKHGGWPAAFSAAPSTEAPTAFAQTIGDEIKESVGAYSVQEESLPLAADPALPFGGKHEPDPVDRGNDGNLRPPRKPKIEGTADNDFHSIDDVEQSEIMAAIRQVFNDGAARDREAAMRDVARELGFERTGSKIQERLDGELIAAVRRSIVTNKNGELSLATRNIEDYSREYLKTLFLSDMGSTWWDREDAINRAARYLGFTRTGSRIYDSLKSIINGLIREGRLESDPDKGIRRT